MALSIVEANPNGIDLNRLYSLIEYNTGVRRSIAEDYLHVLIDLGLCESRPEGIFPVKKEFAEATSPLHEAEKSRVKKVKKVVDFPIVDETK